MKYLSASLSICAFLFFGVSLGYAEVSSDYAEFSIRLDAATIAKGYTVTAFEEGLKLSLIPGILSSETTIRATVIPEMEMPLGLQRISPIYDFEFLNKSAYDATKPFIIELKATEETSRLKQVFFYDKTKSTWRALPTTVLTNTALARSLIHLPYARIALFAYPDVLAEGKASWYAHKKGLFAASPDFPKGSKIRVYNTLNDKRVDVTINDYGPDRLLHPERVVDLEKSAFQKIAPLGAGIIPVRIEPLFIALQDGKALGISHEDAVTYPHITSKAAVVLDEGTGNVLYEKNAETPLPIASLSKIIAIRVFLDSNPNLNDVVPYHVDDEIVTYKLVDYPYEAATLKLKEGDTLTVEDLLYSALVGSANNAVESLVRVSGLPRDEFIQKMNSFAHDRGFLSVHFNEPTGLSPNNVSSAHDYALLALVALRDPIIQKASTMKRYAFSTINTKQKHVLKNSNQLVTSNLAVTGSKTGYLHEAGYCLMTSIQGKSGQIIAVALGDKTKSENTAEIRELLRFGEQKVSAKLHTVALEALNEKKELQQ
ncbi:MAG: RlpA-like double-psi beta-barrel domain-containing protein [Patescibacteria group bacterium]